MSVHEIFLLSGSQGWELPITTEIPWAPEIPYHEVQSRTALELPATNPFANPTGTVDIVLRFEDAIGRRWTIRAAGVLVQEPCEYPQSCS